MRCLQISLTGDTNIRPDVYGDIEKSLSSPEMGGILGMDQSETVVKFYFDATGTTAENSYIPDVKTLNRVIQDWFEMGIYFAGFVHSHVKEKTTLSWADVDYAKTIKNVCGIDCVLMMLYIPETGEFYEYTV